MNIIPGNRYRLTSCYHRNPINGLLIPEIVLNAAKAGSMTLDCIVYITYRAINTNHQGVLRNLRTLFSLGGISFILCRFRCVTLGQFMKKTLFWMILLLALLQVAAAEGPDAKISWTLPTSYANGTPIDLADVQKIVVMVYSGPSRNGP
jgi:hypothetical protein